MQITAVLIALTAATVATANQTGNKHHGKQSSSTDSDTSSSSSSGQLTSSTHNQVHPIVYYPKKGKFVVVKIKSNYAAYPSVCYKNGFKPAVVSRRSLPIALGAVKEACAERAWIRRYEPCQGCDYPKSVAWDEKRNGRVELWEKDQERAYALCEKTNEQICKETGKCCRKYKSGKSEDRCESSSYSGSGSGYSAQDHLSKPRISEKKDDKKADGKKADGKKNDKKADGKKAEGKKNEKSEKSEKKQLLKKKAAKKDRKDCV